MILLFNSRYEAWDYPFYIASLHQRWYKLNSEGIEWAGYTYALECNHGSVSDLDGSGS